MPINVKFDMYTHTVFKMQSKKKKKKKIKNRNKNVYKKLKFYTHARTVAYYMIDSSSWQREHPMKTKKQPQSGHESGGGGAQRQVERTYWMVGAK